MRGNNRANVYIDVKDKYHLMRCIGEAHQHFKFTMVAFCIMSNHFHLLIRSEDELSKIMARINRRYSDYYSKRYRHVGRIYQRRYYAKAIEDPDVLLIVSRYIHRNPIEAVVPMVANLFDYPHSSYPNYHRSTHALPPFLDLSVLPQLLGAPFSKDAEGYSRYCLTPITMDENIVDEWLSGSGVDE